MSGGSKPALDDSPEAQAKREARARKRAWQASPEGRAAAVAAAQAEADAKREKRRQRDAAEAEALGAWGVRDEDGERCSLVDIGANLVKLKGEGSLAEQLSRCQLTGVDRVLVTGTSVDASRRALDVVRGSAASGSGVRLYCTAGVHPHEARTCDESTIDALRASLAAPECVAVGECGLDYDRSESAAMRTESPRRATSATRNSVAKLGR